MPISLHTNKIKEEKDCFIEELYKMILKKEDMINGDEDNKATQLHKFYLTTYVMNHYNKKEHNSQYFNYLMTSIIESESLFVLGFTNAGMMSLRSALESSFKFLYYEYHPIELQLNEIGEFDIKGIDYRNFMYSIPCFQKLSFIKRDEIERIWSELCKYAHYDISVINDISVISDIKPVFKDEDSFRKIKKNIKEVFRVIIIIMFMVNSKWLECVEKSYFDYIFEVLFKDNETINMKISLNIV
ncbi:hypothetical protein [Clostridium saccharobutylicum]|uniref:Uncharacterized protein n=1 Tax=Clostridium saccharobutylicum TaxID=169679 RepID=A0A1S8N3D2_CLOSA|nr:hypothetical protein [Clostridium saccharobutylicum]OOM11009.1 hypothetical protein CLOSAC_25370 [Clostridium saccharobutylicum]